MAFFLRVTEEETSPPLLTPSPDRSAKITTHYRYLCAVYFRRASTYLRATKNFQLAIKRSSLLHNYRRRIPDAPPKTPRENQDPTSFSNRSFIYLLIVPPISSPPLSSTQRSPPHLYHHICHRARTSNTDRADPAEFGSRSTAKRFDRGTLCFTSR